MHTTDTDRLAAYIVRRGTRALTATAGDRIEGMLDAWEHLTGETGTEQAIAEAAARDAARIADVETAETGTVDTLGVAIRVGDTVTVIAWGAPVRLTDTGRRATVTGVTAHGNVTLDSSAYAPDLIARGKAVSPGVLAVARRDGAPGHEGNRA